MAEPGRHRAVHGSGPARGTLATVIVSVILVFGAGSLHADGRQLVTSVQEALATMGYDPGPPDGVAGGNTERAIRAFQEEFGLAVTGVADAGLLERIEAEMARGAASVERRLAREGLLRSYTRAVQEGLVELGIDPGPVDGLVGPLTREAVRAWQGAQGMKVTGEISRSLLASVNGARGL